MSKFSPCIINHIHIIYLSWFAINTPCIINVDECVAGLKSCPKNSMCNDTDVNVNGTATCTCNAGFTGNETMCEGEKYLIIAN